MKHSISITIDCVVGAFCLKVTAFEVPLSHGTYFLAVNVIQQKLYLLQDTFPQASSYFLIQGWFRSHAMGAMFCLGSNPFVRKLQIAANYFII